MIVEYGIMSNKWEVEAESKLTAYATIILTQRQSVNMVVIYNEDLKGDNWAFSENVSKRIGEIFGGDIKDFYGYLDSHVEEIRKASKTIRKIL